MKKLLLLSLLLMGIVSTVSADNVGKQLYIWGDLGNGWTADDVLAMTYDNTTGINTITVTASGTKYFAIIDATGTGVTTSANHHRFSVSSPKDLTQTGSFSLTENTNDNYSNSLTNGTYKISINSETMVMTILKTTSVSFTVTNNDLKGWSQLALYSLSNSLGDWPGVVLWDGVNLNPNSDPRISVTKDGNTFSVTVNVNYASLILNNNKNGLNDDDANNQMNLSDFSDGKSYTIAAQTTPTAYSNTVYFINNSNWSPVRLYTYGANGECFGKFSNALMIVSAAGNVNPKGSALVNVFKVGNTSKGYAVYKIELGDDKYNNLIFHKGSGGSGNQTQNLTDVQNGYYFSCTTSAGGHESAPTYAPETITPAKEYTTYVTPYAMDFSDLGIKAYIAESADASSVTMTDVTTVPANTPLLLKKTNDDDSYNVPVLVSAAAISGNKLIAGDGKTKIGGVSKYDYILSGGMFYRANEGTVAVGKAYLHLDSAPADARELTILFSDDDETDGINAVKGIMSEISGESYNLAGQKVSNDYKGIVIVNGKKVVRK